jgi:hypothetical protein
MAVVTCPHCGTPLDAPDSLLGRQVVCGRCNNVFVASSTAGRAGAATGAATGAARAGVPSAPMAPPPPPGATRSPVPLPPPFAGPAGPATSGFAVASMILGICSLVTCLCYGVLPLICGILALVFAGHATRDIQAGRASISSAGMARAGRICGIFGLVIAAIWLLIGLVAVSDGF